MRLTWRPVFEKENPLIRNAADILLDRIHEWGIEVMFGMPGDGINGIMEALRKRQDKIHFIQVRHEEASARVTRLISPRIPADL